MEARLWLGGRPAEIPARHRQARAVLTAGFQEVAQFFREKGSEWLQAYLT
jgi:hypothetical protein